ncbi:MAG: hypothetical protein ACOZB0_08590 [Pseudomonadota bacterium]
MRHNLHTALRAWRAACLADKPQPAPVQAPAMDADQARVYAAGIACAAQNAGTARR